MRRPHHGPEQSQRSQAAGGVVRGTPASAGRYTGPVRVVVGEHEFGKLGAGDVLVCPVTSPVWSVLFPSVGALVADTGGILSHGSTPHTSRSRRADERLRRGGRG